MYKKFKLASLIAFASVIYPVDFTNSKTQQQNYSSLNHFIVQGLNTHQDRKQEAFRLNKIGIQHLNKGEYREALKTFDEVLKIVKTIGWHKGEASTLHNIGEAYRNLGEYDQSLNYFQQSLAIYKQYGDEDDGIATLNNMALIYSARGQYTKALNLYQQVLPIAKKIGNKEVESSTLNNIGAIYDNQGQYAKALDYYQQSLVIQEKIGDKEGQSTTLNNIASVRTHQGQYAKALEAFEEALIITEQINYKIGEGATLNNIAVIYSRLRQYPKSLKFYQQALAIRQQIGDKIGEGVTLNNIGLVYDKQRQYNKALEYYQKALTIRQKIGDKEGESVTNINIGSVYFDLEQYLKALEYNRKAFSIAEQIGDNLSAADALNNIAEIYSNQEKYAQALDYHQKALGIRQQIGAKLGEASTLHNIAYILLETGKLKEATDTLNNAISIYESLRPGLKDTDKVSIIDTQRDSYTYLQKALIEQNKIEEALEISERSRARAFVDLLASRLNSQNPQINKPPNINQLKQIAKEQKATIVEYSIIPEELTIEGKKQWRESQLYIWLIKPTGEITFRKADLKTILQKENINLEKLVITSRKSINVIGRGAKLDNPPQQNPENQKKRLKQLHELLISPIADELPKDPNQRVIFVPQDSLFLVPFPALQDKDGKYLIEKHTILTAPAIDVLRFTRQKPSQKPTSPNDILVVGNPIMPKVSIPLGSPAKQLPNLPGSEREAQAVAEIFKTTPIIGKNATETAIVQKLPTAKLIHLATHGLLDDVKEVGVPGAIALAPDTSLEKAGKDEGDGLLTSSEIINLSLNADLVVLAACDTGRGRISGDGIIGLSRSLITAGAKSVLVSLWMVDDKSTEFLMKEFYQNLPKSSDKALALRLAMLETKKKFPHPSDWSAFTLIGEAD